MKALVVGAGGQVGRALVRAAPVGARVAAATSAALDITDAAAVDRVVRQERPDILFNAAAYTAVDRAEAEEDRALAINATAVGVLAAACDRARAQLVHISTDFVFDGLACTPYSTDATPDPLGAYGRTKLAGERLAGEAALIVRTGWVHGADGGNFVRTMLRLMAERPEVRVVADQIGTPSHAAGLAETLWQLAARGVRGVFHHSDAGVASWYDFAVAIGEEALARGLLDRLASVVPIASAAFPTPARRPAFSVLDKSGTWALLGAPADHWRDGLRRMLDDLAAQDRVRPAPARAARPGRS